jgi:hypothetical protein
MAIFKKKSDDSTPSPSRIQKMSNADLLDWLNNSIMFLGGAYDQWRFHDAPLELVSEQVDIVNTLWLEYMSRQNKKD